jgi:hypothetical protein
VCSDEDVRIRIAQGCTPVGKGLRAATPLMASLRAPVPAREPWLTVVLNTGRRAGGVPVAVLVEDRGRPRAAAFLSVRRRGVTAAVRMLGLDAAVLPPGGPAARLLAADEEAADRLAEGILQLLGTLRGPWTLRLAGLPLGDPTVRALAARLPTAAMANVRSNRLVEAWPPDAGIASALPARTGDAPVRAGDATVRAGDARELDRWLPALLAREPDRRRRRFLAAAARLHVALGQLELAVTADGPAVTAALVTLVDGGQRWPWWGFSDGGGLSRSMGSPVVALTADGGLRLPQVFVNPRVVNLRSGRR